MEGNGQTKRGAFFSLKRKAKDKEWINALPTTYRMNDKVGDETTTNKGELINSKFPQLKRQYPRTRRNKHVKTNLISGKKKLHKLNSHLIYNLANCMNLRISIASLTHLFPMHSFSTP